MNVHIKPDAVEGAPSGKLCSSCISMKSLPDASARLTTLASSRAAESEEQRWCRRAGLSRVALHAVRQISDSVLAILSRSDMLQGLWDPRNRCCPATLWPSRPAARVVSSNLISVSKSIVKIEKDSQLLIHDRSLIPLKVELLC